MSDNSSDSHQPEPAPAVHQHQFFGPDPLKFDDPTIYHIRDVTPGLTDEDRMNIYCVTRFPKSDLSHMMAGAPPDKDFSNAKPSNQVSANTFASYIEPFARPLTEEDIAFLKEKVSQPSHSFLVASTLTLSREIVLPHLSHRAVERNITLRFGWKKMGC
jgi:transcriptional adapter 3